MARRGNTLPGTLTGIADRIRGRQRQGLEKQLMEQSLETGGLTQQMKELSLGSMQKTEKIEDMKRKLKISDMLFPAFKGLMDAGDKKGAESVLDAVAQTLDTDRADAQRWMGIASIPKASQQFAYSLHQFTQAMEAGEDFDFALSRLNDTFYEVSRGLDVDKTITAWNKVLQIPKTTTTRLSGKLDLYDKLYGEGKTMTLGVIKDALVGLFGIEKAVEVVTQTPFDTLVKWQKETVEETSVGLLELFAPGETLPAVPKSRATNPFKR